MRRGWRRLCGLGLAVAALVALAGETGAASPQTLYLDPVGSFTSPMFLAAPPGDTTRLFIVQQGGTIRVVRNGTLLPTPFLDITSLVLSGGERGLLSMAFAPDYETSRRFYVYYTAQSPTGQITVAELLRDPVNPDIAVPASRRTVITQAHSTYSNHNGGQLQFGPDGYLYAGLGDGGGGGDPFRSGQDLQTLLGKILRIDPRLGPMAEAYTIPADNPFSQPAGRPEIWEYGVRNPWRLSFDRQTGNLVVADVGQNAWEEIDFVPGMSSRGANFGWSCFEGRHSYNTCSPPPPNHTQPVFEYSHARGCSITGGYVVRDVDLPSLAGRYLYSDYCDDRLFTNILAFPDALDDQPTGLVVTAPSSFGEDACGHVYAMGLGGGSNVFRIRDTAQPPQPCPPLRPMNDTWPYATDISGGMAGSFTGTTAGAIGQPGEPNHGGVSTPLNSVWYKLLSTTPRVVTLDTCGSSLDTVIAVYTGASATTLTPVASNDDSCGQQSMVRFGAGAGVTYTVAIDSPGSATGPFTLNVASRVLPTRPRPASR